MFCQISPAEENFQESMCSLQFASRVNNVQLGEAKRSVESGELIRYKQMISTQTDEMKLKDEEMENLKQKLMAAEETIKNKTEIMSRLQNKMKHVDSNEVNIHYY